MKQTSRFDGLFFGCAVGLTLLVGLAVGVPVSLSGPSGGLTDYLIELTVLSAIFGANRLAPRFERYRAEQAALRSNEAAWLTWTADIESRKTSRKEAMISISQRAA